VGVVDVGAKMPPTGAVEKMVPDPVSDDVRPVPLLSELVVRSGVPVLKRPALVVAEVVVVAMVEGRFVCTAG
jgi:hypothetical protein